MSRLDEALENFGDAHVTLMFVFDSDDVLLIEKKTGFGAGLYNGPGGKLEPGDDGPLHAAVRETVEETGVHPVDPEKLGEIAFRFDGDPLHLCHVYRADDHEGRPRETEEARPEWFRADAMPFDRMWDGDDLWFPHVAGGYEFEATFMFRDDELSEWEIRGHA